MVLLVGGCDSALPEGMYGCDDPVDDTGCPTGWYCRYGAAAPDELRCYSTTANQTGDGGGPREGEDGGAGVGGNSDEYNDAGETGEGGRGGAAGAAGSAGTGRAGTGGSGGVGGESGAGGSSGSSGTGGGSGTGGTGGTAGTGGSGGTGGSSGTGGTGGTAGTGGSSGTGGTAGTGGTGGNLGDTGFKVPTAWGDPSNDWSGAGNVQASDGSYATIVLPILGGTGIHDWSDFDFNLPAGTGIVGIEVQIETKCSATLSTFEVSLSWNDGTNYTSAESIATGTSDKVDTLGGSSDTWGHDWTMSELNDHFRLRVKAVSASLIGTITASIDQIQVKVYYTY